MSRALFSAWFCKTVPSYQNIMDSDYFRSLGSLLTYRPTPASALCSVDSHSAFGHYDHQRLLLSTYDTLLRFHDIVEELEKTVEHCEPHLAGQASARRATAKQLCPNRCVSSMNLTKTSHMKHIGSSILTSGRRTPSHPAPSASL